MSAEVFGLTQQILMLISAYINTGVCGKLRIFLAKLRHLWLKYASYHYTSNSNHKSDNPCQRFTLWRNIN